MAIIKNIIITFCLFDLVACNSTSITSIDNPINTNSSLGCESGSDIREQMLVLVNQARAQSRNCGGQLYNAVNPISWNNQLANAAQNHSNDMASNDFFSHQGSNGSDVSDRVQNEGYSWISIGENIFAGAENTQDAINGWLVSTGHCQNIMNPNYTEMGAACIRNPDSQYSTYHTQVFGRR